VRVHPRQLSSDVADRPSGDSAAVAYLPPSSGVQILLLQLLPQSRKSCLFDEFGSEPRAIDVELSMSPMSPKHRVKANCEVILCGGAVATL
jgi:choline dehydrogenase